METPTVKKRRIVQKRAALQNAIAAWLKRESINLHGADIDTVALQMMMGAQAGFIISMVAHVSRPPASFDD